jgi:ParB/RepB/Spo0J family partition protein
MNSTKEIPLDSLTVSKQNARKDLQAGEEDSGLEELSKSIDKHGLLSPLIVRKVNSGQYEIISGQRRYLASKKIKNDPVSCIVRQNVDDSNALTLSLVENVHRADMSPIDKAEAIKSLYDELNSQKKVAQETGWSATTISKYLSLLDLPPELQGRLNTSEGNIGISSASRLAKTYSGDEAIQVQEKIGGFTQKIQGEIIKRTEGDITKVDNLVSQAQEGVFDMKKCGGVYGCMVIKDIIEGNLGEDDFETLLQETANNLGEYALEDQVTESSKSFWRSLAKLN